MIRNRTAEGIARALTLPCSWQMHGCKVENLPFLQRQQHEVDCDFNPKQPCPFSDLCGWTGDHVAMMSIEQHKNSASGKPHDAMLQPSDLELGKRVKLAMLLDPAYVSQQCLVHADLA